MIEIHGDLKELLCLATEGNRQSQRALYQKYSPKLLSICRQYVNDDFIAEDLLVTSFMKIFSNLSSFEQKGVFEAWIRRITVNQCLSYLRANKKIKFTEPDDMLVADQITDNHLMTNDIQNMIDRLPDGCKMVFNLYAVEGYKHQEIAAMLDINESTSKSQLSYARKLLQQMIYQSNLVQHG